jgi:DNA-binding LacI/PurR family transcriptional regulator
MISIQELANKAGVSRTAVSHVLNGREHKVGAEKRQKIMQLVKHYDFQPNALVASLRSKQTHVLGVVIPSVTFSFYPQILDAIETRAAELGYQVLICQFHSEAALLEKQITMLRQRRVDGLIITAWQDHLPLLKRLLKAQVKMILLDGQPDDLDIPFVDVDDIHIGQMATEHLIALGHKQIAHLFSRSICSSSMGRHEGYLKAMHTAGLEPIAVEVENDFGLEAAQQGIKQLLAGKQKFSAIFASTDMAAIGTIETLIDQGYRVPEDVAVIGVGNLKEGQYIRPRLSTISQQADRIGHNAAQAMIDLLNSDQPSNIKTKSWVEPQLIVRQSCGGQINA